MFARVVGLLTLFLLAACGPGDRGTFNPQPSGVITEQLVGPNTVVPTTSLSSPLQVHNGFSLQLSEKNYPSGTFTASIASFTAAGACYTVVMNSTGETATFTPLAFCAGDVESVELQDVRNTTTFVFFQNVGP